MTPEAHVTDGAGSLLSADLPLGNGCIRHLTLNRPAQRNALDSGLLRAIIDALAAAQDDPRVIAVLITGAGAAFCAGGDSKEFVDAATPRPLMATRAGLLVEVLRSLSKVSVPTIAVAAGPALGAGAALLLSCDIAIGARGISIGFPEVLSSVVPAVVAGAVVDRLPPRLAVDLLTTGRRMGLEEAFRLGLVSSAHEREAEAVRAALELSDRWADVDPAVIRATKDLYAEMRLIPRDEALDRGLEVTATTWTPPRS